MRISPLASAALALSLEACSAGGLAGLPQSPSFALGALAPSATLAPSHAEAIERVVAPPTPPSPTPAPHFAGGGAPAVVPTVAPVGDTYFELPSGQRVAAPGGDAVSVPQGLDGLVTYFAPGRVPSTVAIDGQGPTLLHPRKAAAEPAPSGQALLHGQVTPAAAGLLVSYYAPGQRAFVATTTDAAGRFALKVPVDGAARGVLVASDRAAAPRLALEDVALQSGASSTVSPLALASATADPGSPPVPPEGLTLVQRTLTAFSTPPLEANGFAWGVPLFVSEPGARSDYAFDGFSLVPGYTAESADQTAGSVVGGAPSPAFLTPPDLTGLPKTLAAGQALDWPAVPGARLYTVSVSASGGLLWEGASASPHARLPDGLALPSRLSVRVCAWDAPGLSVYTVAALRALRLPETSLPTGRFSWAERAVGAAGK